MQNIAAWRKPAAFVFRQVCAKRGGARYPVRGDLVYRVISNQ